MPDLSKISIPLPSGRRFAIYLARRANAIAAEAIDLERLGDAITAQSKRRTARLYRVLAAIEDRA
jgi:hypothetical protein